MGPFDSSFSRLICTLAPPSTSRKVIRSRKLIDFPPPVLVARRRTEVNGAVVLLAEAAPLKTFSNSPQAWLGPPQHVSRYAVNEVTIEVSLDVSRVLRRFQKPSLPLDCNQAWKWNRPYIGRRPHLAQMLSLCVDTQKGLSELLRADVVASSAVIKRRVGVPGGLMFPHNSAFYACFVQGVLFLEAIEEYAAPVSHPRHVASHRRVDSRNEFYRFALARACSSKVTRKTPREGHTSGNLHSVVARKIGGLNLIMSGSVDCVTAADDAALPGSYMNFVTRTITEGRYHVSAKMLKEWYIRAELLGIRQLYLGLIDESGVVRRTRFIPTASLPAAVAAAAAGRMPFEDLALDATSASMTNTPIEPWDPSPNVRWAFRVLTALRDFFQEAADLASIIQKDLLHANPGVWRVEVCPEGNGLSGMKVVATKVQTQPATGIVPARVRKALEKGRYE
ncbi:hypothetical protein B0H16DRAFT_1446406 [Mycena metata]|uniref:Decapping nuclease n=1 Tax=Mycena metata TaxID=1033252 RepID=A0AAD7KER0_9AGAR|nr:hypothetical protein B0H16DRAFT_1446406 [Mycena metata]